MTIPCILLLCFSLVAPGVAAQENAGPGRDDKSQLPPAYVPSDKTMFKQYCESRHGAEGKSRGHATPTLNTRVPDLTTLSKRRGGKFPSEYVGNVLRNFAHDRGEVCGKVRRKVGTKACCASCQSRQISASQSELHWTGPSRRARRRVRAMRRRFPRGSALQKHQQVYGANSD